MWHALHSGLKSALFFLLWALSSPLSGQSFDPAATYQVKGAELNRLSEDLQTVKNESETLKIKNEQLAKDSESKAKALIELEKRLTTVSESFKKSQNEALGNEIKIGIGAFLAGGAVTLAFFALHR